MIFQVLTTLIYSIVVSICIADHYIVHVCVSAVADQEILRGGFSFTKTPAQLELKTRNSHHQLFESFSHPQKQV